MSKDLSTDSPSNPPSESPRRAIYVKETTGSFWSDFWEACKRVSFQDFHRMNEIPCARSSLVTGIGSGAGIGVVRGLTAGVMAGANWSLGTFIVVSMATWYTCQNSLHKERLKLQTVVEKMPRLVAKKTDDRTEEGGKPAT